MRHRKKTKKLGRTKSHRKATLRNLCSAIIHHQQIKTTLVKAKAAQSTIEKLITFGKKDTVAARRHVFKVLQSHQLVKKLFDEIIPTFADRSSGYTRIIKLGNRRGDGAELAILQLVGFEPVIVESKKTSEKKKKAGKEVKETKMAKEKTVVEEKEDKEPTVKEEKTAAKEKKKEEAEKESGKEVKEEKVKVEKTKEKKATKTTKNKEKKSSPQVKKNETDTKRNVKKEKTKK
jgi:large subunit ribosomal protein L17